MNPIPLTDPTGALRAWMCGCCLHVGYGSEFGYRDADASIVAQSKLRAESCCICIDCAGPAPRATCSYSRVCKACEAKRRAASGAAFAASHEKCARCSGSGNNRSASPYSGPNCPACNGSGWVKRTEAKR